MTFWSGQTLSARLPTLIDPYDPNRIDCAAYELSMGPEYYVTPGKVLLGAKLGTKKFLKPGEPFRIPAGQFALLLTEEAVKIPDNALAFISMKSGPTKWKGLVNVSGFHVDPGYEGRLIFAAYNAGPSEIHMARGDKLFLIWFSDLDAKSQSKYKKSYSAKNQPKFNIPSNFTSDLSGQIYSPMALDNSVRQIKLTQRFSVGLALAIIPIILTAAIGGVTGVIDLHENTLNLEYKLGVLETKLEILEAKQSPVLVTPAPLKKVDLTTKNNHDKKPK